MLRVQKNPKEFYRIDPQSRKNISQESKDIIKHINSTWLEVELTNYLFQRNFFQLNDDPEMDILFSALTSLGNNMYIHLSTIYKLTEKLNKIHPEINPLLKEFEPYLNKIQLIRNCILVHKEKSFFKSPVVSLTSTSSEHLITNRVGVVDTKTKKQEIYELAPLQDSETMLELLQRLNKILS